MAGRRARGRLARLAAVAPVVVPALCAALLASCSTTADQAPNGAIPGFDRGSVSVRSPSNRSGGTLRLAIGQVDSLDPARSYFAGVWNVMRLYTRQLVTYVPAPADAGTQLIPDLASGLGRSSDGGKTWAYTLKPGLRFEDGTPITSSDVKYGIERLFASDTITGGPTWAVSMLDDRARTYTGPYQDRSAGRLGLSSVVTPNDRTIVFHLNRAFADWDYVMALPASSPVPRAKDTGVHYGDQPVSSGPYRITHHDAHSVTFARNPMWSNTTDTVRHALPDRVELQVGASAEQRDADLLAGRVDADVTGSGLQPRAAAKVLDDPHRRSRADNPTDGNVRLLATVTSAAPLDDVHCRRAVQFAVNKAAVKQALGGPYAAALSTSLWSRGLPGYPATVAFPDGRDNTGDLASARRELAACGHPRGFSTKLATVDTGRGLRAATQVSRALARVGIRAGLVRFPQDTFLLGDVGSPTNVARQGIGLVMSSWTTDFPKPSALYVPLTDGRSIHTPGNTDLAELDSADLEKSVDRLTSTLDRGTAITLWQRYDASVMDTAAYVPVVEDRALLVSSSRLHNVYVHRVYGGYDVVSLGVA